MKSKLISPKDVLEAYKKIKDHVNQTPVVTNEVADQISRAQVFFKCENLQKAGSFKFRGAYFALSQLTTEEAKRGVVAFSSGNHGKSLALAAKEMNIAATVVMPIDAPRAKVDATRSYGAEVVLYDRLKDDRESIAKEIMISRGMVLIPPYDHPQVIAGQGTAAVELFQEVGPLDFLFVCVGGGGLIAGSALAAHHFAPKCKVIGVEPAAANDGAQSFKKGELVKIPVPETIADGARTQVLGAIPFSVIQDYVYDFCSVSDVELCQQMKFFKEKLNMLVEPTGCLSAAAVMRHPIEITGKRVGVIVSGGNVDPDDFDAYMSQISTK